MKFVAFLVSIPLFAQQGGESYRADKERAIGQHFAAEIRRQSTPVLDASVREYVERVGRELSGESALPFEVIRGGDWSEPFAVPGGPVFVPARSLVAARDEQEFAGMLAHAVAHAQLRHGIPAAAGPQAGNTASIPLVFLCGWAGSHSDFGSSRALVPVGMLNSQRGQELAADRMGVELMARAGFDAGAFLRYVERVQPADSEMSPLPLRNVRIAALREALAGLPPGARSGSSEFDGIRARVRGAMEEPAPRRVPSLRRQTGG